jgi:hypothetical protein
VKDERVVGGEYKRDVLWVLRVVDGTIGSYRYEHVRPRPPLGTR